MFLARLDRFIRNPRISSMSKAWQLQEAKNQFSLVVEKAVSEGPQTVTRHGKPTVVVVSVADYRKKSRSRRKSLLELFEPLRGVELEIERDRSLPRDPGL